MLYCVSTWFTVICLMQYSIPGCTATLLACKAVRSISACENLFHLIFEYVLYKALEKC